MIDNIDDLAARARSTDPGERVDALTALVDALNDDDELTRADAADALGPLHHPAAGPLLAQLAVGDPSAIVRAAAVESLGDLGDSSHSSAVLAALRVDPDEAVRAYAAASAGILGLPDDELAAAAQSESSPWVRGELSLARYRRRAVAVQEVLRPLNEADELLAQRLLNGLNDLATRVPVSVNEQDLQRVSQALAELSGRIPELAPQAADIAQRWRQNTMQQGNRGHSTSRFELE